MSTNNANSIADAVSTGAVIAIVIGVISGLAACIGCIVIVVCIIKHSNRRRYNSQGVILQQPQPYPRPWTANYPPNTPNYPPNTINYPPNTTSVSNYPPSYPSDPPPYTASASAATKSPYT